MPDSPPRPPGHPVTSSSAGREWDEVTFTRPMRAPFAGAAEKPPPDVDVTLEEGALFEGGRPSAPSGAVMPPGRMDEEATTRNAVQPEVLRAIWEAADATSSAADALDLSKTVEEPALPPELVRERTSR